jgi:hypothetical protein
MLSYGRLAVVLVTITAACLSAQGQPTGSDVRKMLADHHTWAISAAAMLGGQLADAATTSYALDYRHVPGVIETNPLIVRINQGNNQIFGPGGYSFKVGTWAAQAAVQYWLIRRADRQGGNVYGERLAKRFAVSNWIITGLFDGVAIHNARVAKILH